MQKLTSGSSAESMYGILCRQWNIFVTHLPKAGDILWKSSWKDSNSQRLRKTREKQCPLDMTGRMYRELTVACHLHKMKAFSISGEKGSQAHT